MHWMGDREEECAGEGGFFFLIFPLPTFKNQLILMLYCFKGYNLKSYSDLSDNIVKTQELY